MNYEFLFEIYKYKSYYDYNSYLKAELSCMEAMNRSSVPLLESAYYVIVRLVDIQIKHSEPTLYTVSNNSFIKILQD